MRTSDAPESRSAGSARPGARTRPAGSPSGRGTSAVFSPCRTWRYALGRDLGDGGDGVVAFVCLNPSTADEDTDDPTTRRCTRFARDWGFARMELVNLFAFRTTRPRDLRAARDPVGPANEAMLARALAAADLVVCAWGNDGMGPRADALLERLSQPHCLGTTRRGAPRHPLYVPAATRPRELLRAAVTSSAPSPCR